ncbi:plasmid mobilization relaxosome protein MobC [Chitinophaga tropicalis]|uniref:Plasmid mobilization relaxosome protein MobC n=1 Tax=Chitinophaga tropicalis TaxID=2683588 RepID=A0A7K1U046_9BACT|nr:plasmid mobilization relaxosome protein MobC [Chitinophaga tropicalis]MVT07732.1 plasmid mobilization relaxosome protein MobC [Chitinophaga tropicalis]
MARKPSPKPEQLYVRSVRTRVTEKVYQRLQYMVSEGDCNSVGEAARRILSGDKIAIFYVDNSLNVPMQRLVEIRQELRDIGVNINQVTRYFNSSTGSDKKLFHSLNVLERYQQVNERVDELLEIVKALSKKWLQK